MLELATELALDGSVVHMVVHPAVLSSCASAAKAAEESDVVLIRAGTFDASWLDTMQTNPWLLQVLPPLTGCPYSQLQFSRYLGTASN